MLVVGIDVRKKSHTAVAVDQAGVKVAEVTVPATDAGHLQLLGWARQRFGQAPDTRLVFNTLNRHEQPAATWLPQAA
jgi:hypothetical protein